MSLLYDQLLRNPLIKDEIKQHLRECVVIEASNVSDYYYQGTDQEIWHIREDFPNIAPPFETFFLEFHSPKQIVSKVHGVYAWETSNRPIKWGLMCQSQETRTSYNLHTDLGRVEAMDNTIAQLESMEKALNIDGIEKMFPMLSKEQRHAWFDELSDAKKKTLGLYKAGTEVLKLMRAGQWETVEQLLGQALKGAKWELGFTLFAQFSGHRFQSSLGPFWGFGMHVNPDGGVLLQSDGDINVLHHAYGPAEQKILEAMKEDYDTASALHEQMKDELSQFLHTALLAISFMHCKNISLNTVKPERPKPLTNSQKRRGVLPWQPVTYHILDIEPMKKVLKTEGQSEKVGIQKSLHICRGHFSHYGPDKKLFGKYVGTFWHPQHVRGHADVGIATKDYRIKKVTAHTSRGTA